MRDYDELRREAVNAARSYERVYRQRADTFRMYCEAKRDGRFLESFVLKQTFDDLKFSTSDAASTLCRAVLEFPADRAVVSFVVDGVLYLMDVDFKSFERFNLSDVLDLTVPEPTGVQSWA